MRQPENKQLQASGKVARQIAASGMALALCLISLMLFRGVFSLLQALIIPMILVILTARHSWTYQLAFGMALLFFTAVFFPTQFVFVSTYLLMAFVLEKWLRLMQQASQLRSLLFLPYLLLIGLLLFFGLKLTDFVFLTQLHPMMLRLSGENPFRYAAIMLVEAAFVSGLHLAFILFYRRRLSRQTRNS